MNSIQIYTSADGQVVLDVSLDKETVWLLSLDQMSSLLERDKSVVSRHIRNVFRDGELERNSVFANYATTAADGKTYQVDYYNLDVIISIGYRVKSQRGVAFRQWATNTLKQHLVQGYTVNEKHLRERGVEFEQAMALLSRTLSNQGLVDDMGTPVLQVVSDYARSWSLLQGYDEQSLTANASKQSLDIEQVLAAIAELKQTLIAKGGVNELFAQLRSDCPY